MNKTLAICDMPTGRLNFPVDNILVNQPKCRTQAFKQLLSIPPPAIKTASRTWRLTYIIEDFLSHVPLKPP